MFSSGKSFFETLQKGNNVLWHSFVSRRRQITRPADDDDPSTSQPSVRAAPLNFLFSMSSRWSEAKGKRFGEVWLFWIAVMHLSKYFWELIQNSTTFQKGTDKSWLTMDAGFKKLKMPTTKTTSYKKSCPHIRYCSSW